MYSARYNALFALPILLSAAACEEAALSEPGAPVAPLSAAASLGSAGSASVQPKPADAKKPASLQAGGGAPAAVPVDADAGVDLQCARGGEVSALKVVFRCSSVTSYTCKDLSNIVLEFADGSRQRFEGQSGHENSFSGTGDNAGKVVTRVWVKAGANASGEGPGYGERVEAPADSCALPGAGSGGAAGGGGTGGAAGGGTAGGSACEDLPDGACGPGSVAGSGGGGAGGSEACVDLPDQPCSTPVYDVAGAPAPDPDETPSPS